MLCLLIKSPCLSSMRNSPSVAIVFLCLRISSELGHWRSFSLHGSGHTEGKFLCTLLWLWRAVAPVSLSSCHRTMKMRTYILQQPFKYYWIMSLAHLGLIFAYKMPSSCNGLTGLSLGLTRQDPRDTENKTWLSTYYLVFAFFGQLLSLFLTIPTF